MADRPGPGDADLRRLRRRIDALDRRIVALLEERASLALEAGRAKRELGRRAVRDGEREREVLLRVSMARKGPLPTAELLGIYRRLMSAMRRVEAADRKRVRATAGGSATTTPGGSADPSPATPTAPERG